MKKKIKMQTKIKIGILTVSDRAYQSQKDPSIQYEDKSGPTVETFLKNSILNQKHSLSFIRDIVPDEISDIQLALMKFVKEDFALVITTGFF